MSEQNSQRMRVSDQTPTRCARLGPGFWASQLLGLALAGALSYGLASILPLAKYTLPPIALLIFGFLAGQVQGFALRHHFPPARKWVKASSLAGLLAACLSILPTALAASAAGLYAGWAYAWACYGALLGMALQRIYPGHRWMLTSLAGWATAGIVSGVLGWVSDVLRISGTTEMLFFLPSSLSRNWALGGLIRAGAVGGVTGGAITGAALVLQSRLPPSRVRVLPEDLKMGNAPDSRLVNTAGVISGLAAAVLCTFIAPLIVTRLTQGSLVSLDLTIFFIQMSASSLLCVPTYAVVSVPLGIGGGRAGLEIARASKRENVRPWVWSGAAIGGIFGYVLSSLVAFAIG